MGKTSVLMRFRMKCLILIMTGFLYGCGFYLNSVRHNGVSFVQFLNVKIVFVNNLRKLYGNLLINKVRLIVHVN